MTNENPYDFIQLINCIARTDEQRDNPEYIPQLEINQNAKNILAERFESPMSIIVFMGNLGAGKSKLASLTVASLLSKTDDQTSLPFKSGDDPKGMTHGVWMCTRPLKKPGKKGGSILILDCEGMGGNDVKTNNNLYLFCMIVSSVLALVLRPARIDREQCNRLYEELRRFQDMTSPCVLPCTFLVPLELPDLKCNDQKADANQWIEKVFTIDESSRNLSKTDTDKLQKRYNFIREISPNIDVANLAYLPHELKDNSIQLSTIAKILKNNSYEKYNSSLEKMLNKFLNIQGKRLPGSNSIPALLVRPVELTLFMSDLINVINRAKEPNPDELIGQCLLKRFADEIVNKTETEFQKEFLLYVETYVNEKIENQDTNFESDDIHNMLLEKCNTLTEKYIKKMNDLATEKIYGSNSSLLESNSVVEYLNETRTRMESYQNPKILVERINHIYKATKENKTLAELQQIISETDTDLQKLTERICREEMINTAIDGPELQCEVARCRRCQRQAGIIIIIHRCSDGRRGNFYRYDTTRMVCNECRELLLCNQEINCTACGYRRSIIKFIN